MKGTDPITYVYVITDAEGAEHEIAITRRHTGTAYARNGNVGSPTEYFDWVVKADGELLYTSLQSRASAYEHGRAHLLNIDYFESSRPGRSRGVRNFRVVQREMKANYRGRFTPQEDA